MTRPYDISDYLFQKAIAVAYLIAFLSFGAQALGLIGSGGLLPVGSYLNAAREALGPSAYWRLPTLLWLDSSDGMIRAVWIAGAVFALAAAIGALPRIALACCLVLYLSIISAGQSFMTFQWDYLLLEAGLLAVFVDGGILRNWLVRWLLFRLMFLSGLVKLTSGDPTWRSLTALQYYYQTQPLPTPLAWYMHQLPAAFQSASVLLLFLAELIAPVFLFTGKRFRVWAAAVIVALQVLIALTGNYTFFNYLAIVLCLSVLEDAWWPERIRGLIKSRAEHRFQPRWPRMQRYVSVALLAVLVPVSLMVAFQSLSLGVPAGVSRLLDWIAPFGLVNAYGLFANMTTTRPEIIVEASMDGQSWQEYEFRYKPGNLKREPQFVAPYQPRLDWQMWFAALGSYQENPFVVNLMVRLLEARPEVLALLGRAPFGRERPRYVRALLYEYRFTDWATYSGTRAWWTREYKRIYFPAVGAR
jgi:lipase maturation factor 1